MTPERHEKDCRGPLDDVTDGDIITPYATGMAWGESPRWNEGALWASDTQGSRLWTDHDGEWKPVALGSPSNGLWFMSDGRLVGAMMYQGRVGQWNGTEWRTYADLSGLGVGPLGDVVGDAAGNLYIDDVVFDAASGQSPAPGRIILLRPDCTAVVAAEDVEFPNGLAILDDGYTLVVAQTNAQCLTAFDIRNDGTLDRQGVYADLAALIGPTARPDGIWSAGDSVWVATTSAHAIVRVGRNEIHESISTAPLFPIACCLRADGLLIATLADTGGLRLMEAVKGKSVKTMAVLVDVASARGRASR